MVKPSTPQTPSTEAGPDLTPGLGSAELAATAVPSRIPGPPANARAVTVCIPADAEYVLAVRLAVTGVATRMKFSFNQIEEIKLAITEACNNAILHARPAVPDRPLTVTVHLIPGDEQLEIWVTDEGHVPPPGLPVLRAAAPLAERSDDGANATGTGDAGADTYDPLSDLSEGGWGLLLIQSLMDEVEHFTGADHYTTVRMVKRIAPATGADSAQRSAED